MHTLMTGYRARSVGGLAATVDAARLLEGVGADLLVLDDPTVDPLPVLGAIAVPTSTLGLVAALAPAGTPPFILARGLTTLDHLSRGRAGWAVDSARPSLQVRDDSGRWQGHSEADAETWAAFLEEHLSVCDALWDSWEPGAVVMDRDRHRFVDHDKVHAVHAGGRFLRSRGPLNTPPGPQGRPWRTATVSGPEPVPDMVDAVCVAEDVPLDLLPRPRGGATILLQTECSPRTPDGGSTTAVARALARLDDAVHLGLPVAGLLLAGPLDPRHALLLGQLVDQLRATGRVPAVPPSGPLRGRLPLHVPTPTPTPTEALVP